ncbi:MAG: host attachment protein [Rhodobacteraceae bacterium]|nr:host attachment protein [Paracoccaceae bacterium]
MKPVRTLVLVASEGRMRLLENAGVGAGLEEVETVDKDDVPGSEIRFADQRGRSSAAPGMAQHGMEPHSDEREQMRVAFADHVVARAQQRWDGGNYDRLIMAAPPKMLGVLREKLPQTLRAALQADLPKDLANIEARNLAPHFQDVAAF